MICLVVSREKIRMLISTFELLLNKPQLPRPLINAVPKLASIGRELIQGYFLTISNLESHDITLLVSFKVLKGFSETKFDEITTEAFYDFNGDNFPETMIDVTTTENTRSYTLTLPADDTGLFILQPDPKLLVDLLEKEKPTDEDIKKTEVEIRGYVSIQLLPSNSQETNILLTPEHRATFYNLKELLKEKNSDPLAVQPDQIAYALPIAGGNPHLILS